MRSTYLQLFPAPVWRGCHETVPLESTHHTVLATSARRDPPMTSSGQMGATFLVTASQRGRAVKKRGRDKMTKKKSHMTHVFYIFLAACLPSRNFLTSMIFPATFPSMARPRGRRYPGHRRHLMTLIPSSNRLKSAKCATMTT